MARKPTLPRGITIRRFGSGKEVIQLQFVYKGVRCRELLDIAPTKTNLKYAENLRATIKYQIAHRSFRYAEHFPNSPRVVTFGESVVKPTTVAQFLTDHLAHLEDRKLVERSSLNGYRKYANGQLIPHFGPVLLTELTTAHITEWARKTERSGKYIRNCQSFLSTALDDAVDRGLLKTNPCDGIKLKRLLPKAERSASDKIDPFTRAEIDLLLDTAPHPAFRAFFQFAFFTGLRTSELIALEWRHIKEGRITVEQAWVAGEMKSTKTDETRVIDLLPKAKAALDMLPRRIDTPRVFINPNTGKPFSSANSFWRTWPAMLKAANLDYRNLYQTRHTFASMMLSAGENPWWVSHMLGHKGLEMINRHYGKWIPQESGAHVTVNTW